MGHSEVASEFNVDVTTDGHLPGAAEYARQKIGSLGRFARGPILHARVRLTRHADPAVENPVVAQANLDVNGRLVRAQVHGATANESIDRLEARLRQRLDRIAGQWETRRDRSAAGADRQWRHDWEPSYRPGHYPRPVEDREVVRRKSFNPPRLTVDEAADEQALLDYEFHLFTEKSTGQDAVLYRSGSAQCRLALVDPALAPDLSPNHRDLTVSPQPAPRLSVDDAEERLGLLGLPFLFFVDDASGRGCVLYHRYDGHYGLITPPD